MHCIGHPCAFSLLASTAVTATTSVACVFVSSLFLLAVFGNSSKKAEGQVQVCPTFEFNSSVSGGTDFYSRKEEKRKVESRKYRKLQMHDVHQIVFIYETAALRK